MSDGARSSHERTPRIPPGGRREIGWVSTLIVAALGRAAGTEGPPNVFATLARHRRLFRAWLRFAAALMPRGKLPRADTELVILRVAHNCGSDYEWAHHERLALAAGLTPSQIDAVRGAPTSGQFNRSQHLLLRAADELHYDREISDWTWSELADLLSEVELIELPMLVGHYEMLAMTLNTLRVQPDRRRPVVHAHKGRSAELSGLRILITDAARGVGAATARRLHERGADVVLAGLEPDQLARAAADCGDALAVLCDVREREQVEAAVEAAVDQLGGLDVVISGAGDHYTLRAAVPHIAHPRGYALAIAPLPAAHPQLMGSSSASNAPVEALADALRFELASSGAKAGVAYFAELGWRTEAGADAIERAVVRRLRRVIAPRWAAVLLSVRMFGPRLIDPAAQPDDSSLPGGSTSGERSR